MTKGDHVRVTRWTALVAGCAMVALATGCGGDEGGAPAGSPSTTSQEPVTCEEGTAPAFDGTVTDWGEQAEGGEFLVRTAEPTLGARR